MTGADEPRFAPLEESPATLLVVEDEDAVRDLILLMLHFGGYRTQSASGGDEARGLLTVRPPALLITDLEMPAGSGGDLIAFCRARHPDVPILIVSGVPRGRHPEIERCTNGYLTKPFDHRELLATVARLLPCPAAPAKARGRDQPGIRSLDASRHDESARAPGQRHALRAG